MTSVMSCVCGVRLPRAQVPTHPYVPASSGCWEAFGLLQVDEYERFGYSTHHGLIVDAYMASHPDPRDPRNRRSVMLHLCGLHAMLELGFSTERRIALLQMLAHREAPALMWSAPPARTVVEMLFADDEQDLQARAGDWASSVWQAWGPEQQMVRDLVERVAA